MGRDPNILTNIIFSNEVTFNVSGAVNKHNVQIWGSQQLHSVMCNMITGPFFFVEKTFTGSSYLDMLQLYTFPQLEHLQPNVFFFNKTKLHLTGH
jgi:hypothetical protein